MPARYVLVGGGLASVRAAAQLRRMDDQAALTLVSAESLPPYDRPPLSKEILRGEWPRERAWLHAEEFYGEQRIDLRLGNPAQRLDLPAKKVVLADGSFLEFDKLVLATGGRPRPLPIPGADLPGVYYFRTLGDAESLRAAAGPGRRAVIIGAGFIGMEIAASLAQLGTAVTVLEVAPYIWTRFLDQDLAGYFQRYCEAKGIVFHTGVAPTAILGQERVGSVVTGSEEEFPCDVVCIGVGIETNTEVAAEAGLRMDNGVVTNEFLESSHPDVYAAGDIANYYDPIFQKQRRVEHWGHAEYTGLLAAQNMAGERRPYDLVSYVWSDIFDLHLEFAGEEKEYEELLVRGSQEENSFIVMYLRENALRAYLAVNTPNREFLPLQRMIRQRTDLAEKRAQLQDKEVNLRSLL